MDEAGSELNPSGSSAPFSVISLKDDESEGSDCPQYEDLTQGSELQSAGSSALDAPVSDKTLKEEESLETECPTFQQFIHGSELSPVGRSHPDVPMKDDESQSNECPECNDITQDEKLEPPPPYMPPNFPSDPVEISFTIPTSLISEDDARQALIIYAKKKCCYSSGPAQRMTLRSLQPFNTFRYRLDTFTEMRICKWVYDPYYGGKVDGPDNGPAPDPWTLQVKPPFLFIDEEHCMPLPHTSSVKTCLMCSGVGKEQCTVCYGRGQKSCWGCGGSGRGINGYMCTSCSGRGHTMCFCCNGSGYVMCSTCFGKGKLTMYIQVKVKWENHNFEFIVDHKSDFTTECFTKVTGETVFSDEQQMVPPVTSFPEPSINEASENVISQHRAEFTYCKILKQRQNIEWLPLTKVNYTWNGAEYNYYVYGKENQVFTKKYPINCCCIVM